MSFKFPFTNYHELNLDWILKKVEQLFNDSMKNVETINTYEGRLTTVEGEVVTIGGQAQAAQQIAESAQSVAVTAQQTGQQALALAQTAQSTAAGAINASGAAMQEAQAARQESQQAISISQNTAGQLVGQMAALQTESERQQQLIEEKGDEVIASIPSDYTDLQNEVSDLKSAIDEISDVSYTPVDPPNLYDGGSLTITDATQQQDIVFSTPYVNALKIEFDCVATDVTSIVVQIRSETPVTLEQKSLDVTTGVRSSVEFQRYDAGVKTIVLKLKTNHESTASLIMSNISVTQTDLPPAESRTAKDEIAREEAEAVGNALESSVVLQGCKTAINASNYATLLPDMNGAEVNRVYKINGCLQSISNIPPDRSDHATLITYCNNTYSNKSWYVQIIVTRANRLHYRGCWGGTWTIWKTAMLTEDVPYVYVPDNLLNHYFVSTCVDKTKTKMTAGEKIVAFGDSIMAGPTGTPWISMFCDIIGTTVENMAVAGALFGHTTRTEDKWLSTQLAAATTGNKWANADYVIVAAGTNDAGYDTPISEVRQYVQDAIDIIKANTDAHIIFITPIRRGGMDTNSNNLKLPQIAGVIENVALQEGCSVINGYDIPIPTYSIDGIIDNLTDSNGLHPNTVGREIYARSVINALM